MVVISPQRKHKDHTENNEKQLSLRGSDSDSGNLFGQIATSQTPRNDKGS
jgi:hypothetical protein